MPASGNSTLDAEYLPPASARPCAGSNATSSPDADKSARGPVRQETHEHASF